MKTYAVEERTTLVRIYHVRAVSPTDAETAAYDCPVDAGISTHEVWDDVEYTTIGTIESDGYLRDLP